jgi:DNA-binding NtrC family response regulator
MYIDKGKILVIDDEPSVADALRIILEDDGHEVAVALTGLQGLELVRQRSFDVVVSDLRLPDITGLDVLDAICRGCPRCVVIIITSQNTTNLLDESKVCAPFDVLQKPFFPEDVLRLVSAALGKVRCDNPECLSV